MLTESLIDPHATAMWLDLADQATAEDLPVEAAVFTALSRADDELAVQRALGPLFHLHPERAASALTRAAGVWQILGRPGRAEPLLLTALQVSPGHLSAYLCLANLRLPGPTYYEMLDRLHEWRRPTSYLEIGTGDGTSMALARPPAVAIGVDPVPTLRSPVCIECHIYPQRSEDFFARDDLDTVFAAGPPDLVFIDGLHTFPAVLADLAAIERISRPDTIVVLHDTIPLDEPTQRPDQQHAFYTGDVWKLLPCLTEVRPDLQVFTALVPPSGLTFITGLDPTSTVLADRRDELLERFGSLPFDPDASMHGELVPNDWATVRSRLGG